VARGVSDQRKEQIMRSVMYIFTAAFLTAVWQFSPASAQTPPAQSPQTDVPQAQLPQTDVPQAQPPAQTNRMTSIPDQKLDAAAAAIQHITSLKRDYQQLLADAPRMTSHASPTRPTLRSRRPSPIRAYRSRNTPPLWRWRRTTLRFASRLSSAFRRPRNKRSGRWGFYSLRLGGDCAQTRRKAWRGRSV